MTNERAPATFAEEASSPNPEVRWRLAAALTNLPGVESEETLIALMGDEDYRVREKSVAALTHRFTPRVAAACAVGLEDDANAGMRGSSLTVLSRVGNEGRMVLLNALHHREADVRLAAAMALPGLRADARTVAALEAAVRSEADPNARAELLLALGRSGRREAIASLLAVLEEGNLWLRVHALEALGEIGDPEVAPRLLPLLDQPPLRRAVLRTLARLDSSAPAEDLARRAFAGEIDGSLLAALRRAVEACPDETLPRIAILWPDAAARLAAHIADVEVAPLERTDAAHLMARLDLPNAAGIIIRNGPFEDGFEALGALAPQRFTEALHAVLQQEDPEPALALVLHTAARGTSEGLAPLLVHPSSVVRSAVLGALPPGAVTIGELLDILAEEDPETALPAAFALAAEGVAESGERRRQRIGALLDRARGADGPGRSAALLALPESAGADADHVIRLALTAADPEVRRTAATAASRREGITEAEIAERLVDDDHSVRAAALRTLGTWKKRGTPELELTWRDLLTHLADEPVAAAAAGGAIMAFAGTDRARLAEEMLSQDGTIRLAALEEIVALGDPAAAEAVAYAACHEDTETARAVLYALRFAPAAAAEPALALSLCDARPDVRRAAAEAIWHRPPPESFDGSLSLCLSEALATEREPETIRPLLCAVAIAGGPSSIEPLTALLARERTDAEADEAALALATRFPDLVRATWATAPARAERRWARALQKRAPASDPEPEAAKE
ncbi:MAG: HEAT repeat domain-containing protein [Thermoanaerobaculia bacterium]